MTSISFSLSGKLDQSLVEALRTVTREADALSIPFFVVGATARDLVLEHCHAIQPKRATLDLDIGIEVAGWEEFERLSTALVSNGGFARTQSPQKLIAGTFELDVLPFGDISGDSLSIKWPPDHAVIMKVMGFQEAYVNAMTIRISDDPILDVKVPTIPGMALMKIISWSDSYPERPRDAADLLFLMENYAEAGNENRLYGEEASLSQEEDFELERAGIRLLGRDMAAIAKSATSREIRRILDEECGGTRYRLVHDVAKENRLRDNMDKTVAKLGKLRQGFIEQLSNQKER